MDRGKGKRIMMEGGGVSPVAVGTDGGVVVLVTGRHEGQAVGVDLMAGDPVSLRSLLLALAQLPVTQGLQHLSTDLQHTKGRSQFQSKDQNTQIG
ncbi:hypothetical protein EYF80_038742 [Liparis tanakae]|uniref:Uncharacterized protein n=1 Tax=Liparis tanakae TaxID=230148 RepID=A0A4Z2GCV6_9TELE|nr:hypothetical protein EYF80_038742 [Liparis tanakae]